MVRDSQLMAKFVPQLPTNRADAGYLIVTPKTIYLPIQLNL
jgi:hypothetical protein